jgi:uncharacterized protein (DUF488 family)
MSDLQTILSFGYRGHTTNDLLQIVRRSGEAAIVVDVRRDAHTGTPQWTNAALCDLLGAQYLHMPALGNAPGAEHGKWKPLDVEAAKSALDTLVALYADSRRPVILLCAEFLNRDCHRRQVAEQLRRRLPVGAEVKHLL